jgi:transposase
MSNPLPAAKPDHRTLPRKKRAPNLRDQAILVAYRVEGRTQAKLAEDYDLSQSRISAIIRRVERWRADLIPAAENELDGSQRQRLERWLERERLQAIHTRAMRAHDAQVRELKTVREGHRDGKPFQDETRREQQPNVLFLKLALRATTDIGRLNDKPVVDDEHEAKDARARWWQAYTLLLEIRRDARDAGQLGPKNSGEGAIVQEWMKVLTGEKEADENVGRAPRSAGTRGSDVPLATNSSSCSNAAAAIAPNVPPAEPLDEATEAVTPADVPTPEPARSAALAARSATPQKKKTVEQLPLAERRLTNQEKLAQLRANDEANKPRRGEAEAQTRS